MTYDDLQQLITGGRLEADAAVAPDHCVPLSMAISLKRIADAVEKLPPLMSTEIDATVNKFMAGLALND